MRTKENTDSVRVVFFKGETTVYCNEYLQNACMLKCDTIHVIIYFIKVNIFHNIFSQ